MFRFVNMASSDLEFIVQTENRFKLHIVIYVKHGLLLVTADVLEDLPSEQGHLSPTEWGPIAKTCQNNQLHGEVIMSLVLSRGGQTTARGRHVASAARRSRVFLSRSSSENINYSGRLWSAWLWICQKQSRFIRWMIVFKCQVILLQAILTLRVILIDCIMNAFVTIRVLYIS